jgi:hypothetical protein
VLFNVILGLKTEAEDHVQGIRDDDDVIDTTQFLVGVTLPHIWVDAVVNLEIGGMRLVIRRTTSNREDRMASIALACNTGGLGT